ncbi:TFP11-domain-containing protein [Punctularia strigosozonata HHB-11173 SS5]|uniref:TFP11-domain-containing protein n=1 Tax=Punctularia strigosozonata (strain HHB-11173) TaxID=741275 RepID=UPI0004417468|nr:TFP11-domain-containing protein [Punctularia strigosozonata HHB-11173 SS5]EIN09573.1 TFP11-domain-containing protein [Punctularia strigosozonata HHB-11173 SS5]
MARRKRQFLSDGDSDSSPASDDDAEASFDTQNPDARAERELFENPYGHKRRRKDEREDAIYGVFGDDSEEEAEGFRGRGGRGRGGGGAKRSDWTKAPAFVGGQKVEPSKTTEVPDVVDEDAVMEDGSDADSEEDDDEDDADQDEPPMIVEDDYGQDELEEQQPRIGGIGSGKSKAGLGMSAFSRGGIGSRSAAADDSGDLTGPGKRTGGIGFSRGSSSLAGFSKGDIGSSTSSFTPAETDSKPAHKGSIGSNSFSQGAGVAATFTSASAYPSASPAPATHADSAPTIDVDTADLPASFGSAPRTQRAFVRTSNPASGSATPAPLDAKEQAHFASLQGSFGARMLAKMGWQAGTGLGATGTGIVTPVESKLRPKGMGIAFKGFREKTEQSKMEAKRRGETVSDEEEEGGKGRRARKGGKKETEKEKRAEAWKRPRKVKTRVEHKTYEEIVAEAGEQAAPAGVGVIIDATGATPREVASLADVSRSSWTPSTDPTRLPELRHNLRLIVESAKGDLDGLAREAKALEERKKWVRAEEARLAKKVQDEAELIKRLQEISLVANDISSQAKELASAYEPSLDVFSPNFEKLYGQYTKECERYRLDEIVVAAIAPAFRRMLASWNPLEDPSAFVNTFWPWRGILKIAMSEDKPETQIDVFGTRTVNTAPLVEKPMTPFESLLWNAWLPKIRSVTNNEWLPENPAPLVRLYETWSTLLPPFIRDNFFDQLVLPKVQKAVAEWNPKKAGKDGVPLQRLVFPWLPHLGLRMEDLLGDARRKVKSLLRAWKPEDGLPEELLAWKDVFDVAEWDNMMLKYVVPKLGATLRDDFRVNPRAQDMEPLQRVLAWSSVLRPSIFSSLLESTFFPKWLEVLHFWLVQPGASYEEIAQWYSFWKSTFPEPVQRLPGVARGFTQAQQLMNEAIVLGPEGRARLPRPELTAASAPASRQATPKPAAQRPVAGRTQEITFRSIVEEHAAAHNLLFIPTGRAHEKSRMPLYRVSQTADGKKGLLVYIDDDAVWAPDGEDYRAISLEEMVLRATKTSSS